MFDAVRERARKTLAYARLVATGDSDARGFYDIRGSRFTVLADVDELSNFGYWQNVPVEAPDALRLANEALFELVAEWARLEDGQRVLDVGCGFGHGALHFARRHPRAQIVGLNLSGVQIEGCRRRAAACERVSFVEGSATAMPFGDAEFDRIVCVDAALHFDTREQFFREAWRVLRPGGLMVIADMVLPAPRGMLEAWNIGAVCRGSQIPRANLYDRAAYIDKLQRARFEVLREESMYRDVLHPFNDYVRRNPDKTLAQPLLFLLLHAFLFAYPLDYLMVASVR